MRFARRDVRDHIVSSKIDGPRFFGLFDFRLLQKYLPLPEVVLVSSACVFYDSVLFFDQIT